jgi:hypothetical protein
LCGLKSFGEAGAVEGVIVLLAGGVVLLIHTALRKTKAEGRPI